MDIEDRFMVAKAWGRVSKGRGLKVQTSMYKISPGDVTYNKVTKVNNTVQYI